MPRRIAIVQSSFIPWRGYFDLIRSVDVFVLYDDAQYTVRDWRNRNRIKTRDGVKWLTVPVEGGARSRAIRDVRVSDTGWSERHWRTIAHNYTGARHWQTMRATMEPLFRECRDVYLSEINYRFLTAGCRLLEIGTTFRWSSEFQLERDRSGRLVDMCRQAGAGVYVSGPSAKAYLDRSQFDAAGIEVEFFDYDGYPEYPQLFPPFEPHVSVVDLLLNTGPAAAGYLARRR